MSRGPKPKHSQQPPGVVQNWSALQCSEKNTEQCGYDHAPVTRGRMRAQYPLPHGLCIVKERERERERGQERERGREGERDPQSKSRGLTGTVGGWWV